MPRIRLLPDPLISQIAAGEVVERPASVLKELIENALDAGATEVDIELDHGGRSRVSVADDGSGMGRDDALLAFDRHATSKIGSFADLERVATLGFRGEALAAIAAVARVELVTAEQPGDGQKVVIEGGRIRHVEPCAVARGTRVEVRSLFFNVPARRKFLKSGETELRRCLEVAQGYALTRPEVTLRLRHEGRMLLDAPASGDGGLRERVRQIFGAAFAAELADLPPATGRPGERLSGLVGGPPTARSRRQFVIVNRRLVRDRAVLATFYRAVREEWRVDDFPALFLVLELPPEEVDVNVHPQKTEVRFRDAGILDRIGELVRRGLERARREEPAPLRAPQPWGSIPTVWQGTIGSPPIEVREASGTALPVSAPLLPAPSLAPASRAPVPLSGRHGDRPFRLLGQYKGTLILLEGPDGLYLIDQHVAHERLLFERLRLALAAEQVAVQSLLDPPLLELSAAERLRLAELAPALERAGFELAGLSGGTLALTAAPAALDAQTAVGLLEALASGGGATAEDPGEDNAGIRRQLLDALAASSACKQAVKMHHPLSAPEMEALVSELFAADQPYACPHGRPIVLQMSDSDLERRFGRR